LGVGLSVSSNIARLINGELKLVSNNGKPTIFEITIREKI
jgi:signal transduction histidine kinase